TASRTGLMSVGELEMTLRISAVAVCCSRASASRFLRSRTLASLLFGDLRAIGGLAPTLGFAGFGPRPISLPLPPYESAGDRLGEPVSQGKGTPTGACHCRGVAAGGGGLVVIPGGGGVLLPPPPPPHGP